MVDVPITALEAKAFGSAAEVGDHCTVTSLAAGISTDPKLRGTRLASPQPGFLLRCTTAAAIELDMKVRGGDHKERRRPKPTPSRLLLLVQRLS